MAAIITKSGVDLSPASEEAKRIIDVAGDSAPLTRQGVVVVTSGRDGEHMEGSLHPLGRAFDFRVQSSYPHSPGNVLPEVGHDIIRTAEAWVKRMQYALGEDYDVVLESRELELDTGEVIVYHIHAEYDPPGGVMPSEKDIKKAREAIKPLANTGVTSIAAFIGQLTTFLIVANNPELAPVALLLGTGITGALGGIGNHARTMGGWAKRIFGWIG